MKEYICPKVVFYKFDNEVLAASRNCNCNDWVTTNDMDAFEPGCEAKSVDASELGGSTLPIGG